ncbi:YxeA family protein [Metabacillus fastidiosus]|uniref:YxeA family protein n=1 Tax=Metabacillus fastidiosus TaxID=1458 RepID=UPI002DBA6983|nr:YxeA family protein [Metabacillus fastidiosus]MEC2074994.1 YxeA family protein [Metabacillus fastidiosus]
MKKFGGFIIAIVVVVIGFGIFIQNVNLNRIGKDQYYIQIAAEGNKIEGKSDNGEVYVRYEYKLPAFDQSGNEKELAFTAPKELRQNAYLMLYVKDGKEVTSYQEVKEKEIPEKAADKLAK